MLNMISKRGALIVLEGCDRAGKSTQVKMLMNALNDLRIPAKNGAFPSKLHVRKSLIRITRLCLDYFAWEKVFSLLLIQQY